MANRQKCLVFLRYYLPGYQSGGPVRSISNLIEAIGDRFEFYVVTSNRDFLKTEPYSETVPGWNLVGRANVFYIEPSKLNIRKISEIIKQVRPNLIYTNSFFDRRFTLPIFLLKRMRGEAIPPVICAPRGEFAAGALELKAFRKKVFFNIFKLLDLKRKVAFHATSQQEAVDIRDRLSNHYKVFVASNLFNSYQRQTRRLAARRKANKKEIHVVFISRIHPKKNLDFAIECLAEVESRTIFNIYGPIDDEAYWNLCKALIAKLPSNITTHYHGAIEHAKVATVLALNDLFLLPTKGENFGHVIIEALQAGLPVLISDRTPWKDLNFFGVGTSLPLTVTSAFSSKIDEVSNWKIDDWWRFSKQLDAYLEYLRQNSMSEGAHIDMFSEMSQPQI